MTKTFTQIDAIRYVYGEFSTTEEIEFEKALIQDEALRGEVNALHMTQEQLDSAILAPSQNVVDRILSYAKSFNLHSK